MFTKLLVKVLGSFKIKLFSGNALKAIKKHKTVQEAKKSNKSVRFNDKSDSL
jgi:hypothetical protein